MEAPSSSPIASPTEPVGAKCSGEQAQENYATQFATGPVFRGAEIHDFFFLKGPSEVVHTIFFLFEGVDINEPLEAPSPEVLSKF